MKTIALMLASLAASASAAAYAAPPLMEHDGYEPGSLAVAAIGRGDWTMAESLLTRRGVSEDDPARLINLGRVYMETGREGMALSAWRQAAAGKHHFEVETADGQVISTRELALQLIDRYQPTLRTARN